MHFYKLYFESHSWSISNSSQSDESQNVNRKKKKGGVTYLSMLSIQFKAVSSSYLVSIAMRVFLQWTRYKRV